MTIEIRQAISPDEAKGFDTAALRSNFLIDTVFVPGKISLCYSHLDRTVVGGAMPLSEPLVLRSSKAIGSDVFLARREMGVFVVGGAGRVTVDGEEFALQMSDCLYLPMGCTDVSFTSDDAANPAKFYLVSTPAHHRYKIRKITADQANRLDLGSQSDANKRVLRQYIHPDICDSCQLVMGMTSIEDGSVWNTMPAHIHDRRSEVYLYFDMAPETRVFHFMGEPAETRHMVIANEQAILSPGWSIHCGAGTGRYAFIWSMAGDNQDFTDMDFIAMEDLR
ncbi:MAG: 5-dehydro-4-deoxy-D-glucuronate isomerase [Rhodobacteraceae bacterium]|nr:5-dehydro-4-deoxy-D-glucuronate isomerase [Paracoccaceae bacterium]